MTKHKILIIEDDPDIANIQRIYLEAAGLTVKISGSGEEGLRLALEEKPTLVVLDLNLPGVDGYEVCRRLRERADVLIVMVTALACEEMKIKGLEAGAVDYVVKPFSPSELTARVLAHLAQYERIINLVNRQRREISFGRVLVRADCREVFVDGLRIELANKEYGLLILLSTNPNQNFTKDRIYREVWGRDRCGDLKTVAVHIRRLRDKLEDDPARPRHIQTIKGAGYRFVP